GGQGAAVEGCQRTPVQVETDQPVRGVLTDHVERCGEAGDHVVECPCPPFGEQEATGGKPCRCGATDHLVTLCHEQAVFVLEVTTQIPITQTGVVGQARVGGVTDPDDLHALHRHRCSCAVRTGQPS